MRNMQLVEIYSISPSVNEYGERLDEQKVGTALMSIFNLNKTNTTDMRYIDGTDVGLTKANLTCNNTVISGDAKYKVLYVIPTHRFNQVFLQRVK